MNRRFAPLLRAAVALGLALGAPILRAADSTSAALDLHLYAGVTVTGPVGTVFSIEYINDLSQTNNLSAWHCLEFLQLPSSPYLWTDRSAPAAGQRLYRAVTMAGPTNMIFIQPGTFRMGSATNEAGRDPVEGPQTAVTISRGFWMGTHEVTQGEYQGLMATNPSAFTGDLSRPVEQVSWIDATNYCTLLTARERMAGKIPSNSIYRLPTEAEWEYACRAWTSTRFDYGEDPGYTNLSAYAWYTGSTNTATTQPVGLKRPNLWGLYDMHGNVWEWCQDWWSDSLTGGAAADPEGPSTGTYRVFRGGSWFSEGTFCRCAYRFSILPGDKYSILGFRVVLVPGPP